MVSEAKEAWLEGVERFSGNPSSLHRVGDRAERALGEARERVASILDCHPLDILWTSGATEANNTVFWDIAARGGRGSVLLSRIEHPCALRASERWLESRREWLEVNSYGIVDLEGLEARLQAGGVSLVGVMAANNETGVIQPWEQIAALCEAYGVDYFCDAAQWLGKEPARGLGAAAYVSGSGHKFGGPRGVGFLKIPKRGLTSGLLLGGSQERGFRAGTENVPGALALAAALELRERAVGAGWREAARGRREMFATRLRENVPGIRFVGEEAPHRLWNTCMALMPETECPARWVVKLDKAGVAVSSGSACASGEEKGSHVLLSMGYTDSEAARALRFSGSWETTEEEWVELAETVGKVARELMPEAEFSS